MFGQSYWGHGPQYGVIHKQDFTKPGASSIWLDLVDYGVRDSTELLVVIGNNVIEPRSGFRLHKHPSPKLELITSDTGIGFVSWLQTKTTKPSFDLTNRCVSCSNDSFCYCQGSKMSKMISFS